MDCQATGCDKSGSIVELIFSQAGLSLCLIHFQESEQGKSLSTEIEQENREARAKTMGSRMWADHAQSKAEDKAIEQINKEWA